MTQKKSFYFNMKVSFVMTKKQTNKQTDRQTDIQISEQIP